MSDTKTTDRIEALWRMLAGLPSCRNKVIMVPSNLHPLEVVSSCSDSQLQVLVWIVVLLLLSSVLLNKLISQALHYQALQITTNTSKRSLTTILNSVIINENQNNINRTVHLQSKQLIDDSHVQNWPSLFHYMSRASDANHHPHYLSKFIRNQSKVEWHGIENKEDPPNKRPDWSGDASMFNRTAYFQSGRVNEDTDTRVVNIPVVSQPGINTIKKTKINSPRQNYQNMTIQNRTSHLSHKKMINVINSDNGTAESSKHLTENKLKMNQLPKYFMKENKTKVSQGKISTRRKRVRKRKNKLSRGENIKKDNIHNLTSFLKPVEVNDNSHPDNLATQLGRYTGVQQMMQPELSTNLTFDKQRTNVSGVNFNTSKYPSDLSGETQAEKRQRIKEICERVRLGHYSLQGRKEDPTSPRWRKPTKHGSLLKAIVDHYHKVVYCDIGKTGTSSWHAVFENMMKRERSKRTRLYKKHPYKPYKITEYERFRSYFTLGFNRLTRGPDAHAEVLENLPDPRNDYFKFLVVRHPLERLASAYFSRVYHKKKTTKQMRDAHMMSEESKWMSFEEFLNYVALADHELTVGKDYHWLTYQSNCEPCSVEYDYISHTETIDEDALKLLPKFNADDQIDKFPRRNKGNSSRSSNYLSLYHNVSHHVVQAVMDKYQVDADMFGYNFDDYIKK